MLKVHCPSQWFWMGRIRKIITNTKNKLFQVLFTVKSKKFLNSNWGETVYEIVLGGDLYGEKMCVEKEEERVGKVETLREQYCCVNLIN